jgi:phenylacetate-CoA ligase
MLEPDVETRPWAEQLALDDASYRAQLGYFLERSAFYREKLGATGIETPADAGGLADIGALPLTEKAELRETVTPENPIGAHLCAEPAEVVRIYSTSGTTGTPSFIPLTARDLDDWITGSARSYAASGITAGQRIVSTYNAGPFVAGAALESFDRIGLCHIPVGTGNTERLLRAVELLRPDAAVLTPSYAAYLVEAAAERGLDLAGSSVERVLVAGEPGGGEPAFRCLLEQGWGARVTEAMGIGDIGISLWGECEEQDGMHLGARGLVHPELIDAETGEAIPLADGASGELVLTHLRHRAAPLLRFRTRDHVDVRTSACPCGRTAPRVRCVGRTDDMLLVRGVNVFPSAVRDVVGTFAPRVSGQIRVRAEAPGVKQDPPLPVAVELARGAGADADLAEAIREKLRAVLVVQTRVELVPWGSLARDEYKGQLIERKELS